MRQASTLVAALAIILPTTARAQHQHQSGLPEDRSHLDYRRAA